MVFALEECAHWSRIASILLFLPGGTFIWINLKISVQSRIMNLWDCSARNVMRSIWSWDKFQNIFPVNFFLILKQPSSSSPDTCPRILSFVFQLLWIVLWFTKWSGREPPLVLFVSTQINNLHGLLQIKNVNIIIFLRLLSSFSATLNYYKYSLPVLLIWEIVICY